MYISPEMELMAGVLTQTDWIKQRGPSGIGNEYYRALKEFMYPYRNHPAVQLTQKMVNRGFQYDEVPPVKLTGEITKDLLLRMNS